MVSAAGARRRWLTTLLLIGLGVTPVAAHASSSSGCVLGGPTPGARVLRLHLPAGSDYTTLRLTSTRPLSLVSSGADWHLVQGVFLLTARTHRLLDYRLAADGANPARTMVAVGGRQVVDAPAPGPNAPFVHTAGAPLPELRPGDYDVVGFGSSGAGDAANRTWSAEVVVSGAVRCRVAGSGRVFDHPIGDFHGGTVASAYGVTTMTGAQLRLRARGRLVLGVMQATTQAAGTASLVGKAGRATARVRDGIAPFILPGGRQSWRGDATGAFAVIDVAGVTVTL